MLCQGRSGRGDERGNIKVVGEWRSKSLTFPLPLPPPHYHLRSALVYLSCRSLNVLAIESGLNTQHTRQLVSMPKASKSSQFVHRCRRCCFKNNVSDSSFTSFFACCFRKCFSFLCLWLFCFYFAFNAFLLFVCIAMLIEQMNPSYLQVTLSA